MSASGGSMAPFILDGDVVELEAVDGMTVRLGQILLVRHSDDCFVLHRLVRIRPGEYSFRGDALTRCDPPVRRSHLLARVVGVRRQRRARDLPRWFWQFGGLVWTRCSPLAPDVFRVLIRARRLVLKACRAFTGPATAA